MAAVRGKSEQESVNVRLQPPEPRALYTILFSSKTEFH